MDSGAEMYPVCPHRNTTAAYRWFYQSQTALSYLKRRTARSYNPTEAATSLLSSLSSSERTDA